MTARHVLVASDFDQTLSFNDSGQILSELLGVSGFEDKVAGLAASNLVQQGGELAYLIRHDPEFRGVRREHLMEAGRRVRLRKDIPALVSFLERGLDGCRFSFFVISAAPRELSVTLAGISPDPRRDRAGFRSHSQQVRSIRACRPATGRWPPSRARGVPRHRADRTIYIGDGSSTSRMFSARRAASRSRSPKTGCSRESRRRGLAIVRGSCPFSNSGWGGACSEPDVVQVAPFEPAGYSGPRDHRRSAARGR